MRRRRVVVGMSRVAKIGRKAGGFSSSAQAQAGRNSYSGRAGLGWEVEKDKRSAVAPRDTESSRVGRLKKREKKGGKVSDAPQ